MENKESYLNDMVEDSVVWKGNYGEVTACLYKTASKKKLEKSKKSI